MIQQGSSLELIGISKSFDSSGVAVKDANLKVNPGEFVTLLGPSGSGKTTTLNMIAGFLKPTSGSIILDDEDVADLPVNKRNIGMVFQQFSLFPHMTVGANIAFPLKERRLPRDTIRQKVADILETVKLGGFENRKPSELSGGQQQRVALARAVVFEPRLLLMDEPLSALDKKLRERLQIEIKQIQSLLGITCIFVTHDQEEALLLSDRVAVFNEGEIIQVDSPSSLYERPSVPFVAEFVGDSNILSGEIRLNGSTGPVFESAEGRLQITAPQAQSLVGRRVQALIRPENMSLDLETKVPAQRNCLPGTLADRDYFGSNVKFVIATDCGRTIYVRQAGNRSPDVVLGARVCVTWDPNDVHYLPY